MVSTRTHSGVDQTTEPAAFAAAVASMQRGRLRPEVSTDEMPAPQRIAPFAAALAAEVTIGDHDVATGRIIVLHDPLGNHAWDGTFRVVAYARADIEPEQVSDPLLPEVGWTYLIDALDANGAHYSAVSGTVTRVATDGFGTMSQDGSAQLEVRASWTPDIDAELSGVRYPDMAPHVSAWGRMMCEAAGLEPLPEGVTMLSPRGVRTGPGR